MIPRTAIPIGNKEIAALSRVSLSDSASERPVREFEQELGNYLGLHRVFTFNSGRSALSITLQALELKPENEILIPAYTCAIVFEVALRLGLKIKLVDVDPRTYNIDPDEIEKSITTQTKAIIPVHLFGQACEMNEILEISKKHGLFVIEDAAQALGAKYKKAPVGTFGDMAVFSFGPGKSITAGEGGALAVKNPQFEDKVAELKDQLETPDTEWNLTVRRNVLAMKTFSNQRLYGRIRNRLENSLNEQDEDIVSNCLLLTRQSGQHIDESLKSTVKIAKMPAISARIGKIQLKRVDSLNRKRETNAAELSTLLQGAQDFLALPETSEDAEHTFNRFTVRVLRGSRDLLVERLLKWGIDCERPYFYLPRLFEIFSSESPAANELARTALTLPNHPLVSSADRAHIAKALTNELKTLPTVTLN